MQKFQEERKAAVPNSRSPTQKVNKICDALRAELEKVNDKNVYLLPVPSAAITQLISRTY